MANNSELDSWLAPLAITRQQLGSLTERLASAYSRLALESDDQFLATPVTKLPTGEEKGEYLAIDLGGSNLRVAFVKLLGAQRVPGRRFSLKEYDERIEKYNEKSWPIAESLKDERAEDLFAWIGDCLAEVIRDRYMGVPKEDMLSEIPLGVTFSFPMMQSTLSEAKLLPMGKGFSITSNPDLGFLVKQGYERHAQSLPRIKLVAIANDSVTTLISLSYTTRAKPGSKAVVGLILGTGCNAAVPMKPSYLSKKKVEYATRGEPAAEIVINTEWTIRGVREAMASANVFTPWDDSLDNAISTPGFQPFEYLTAGSYLGEVVRLSVFDYFTNKLNLNPLDLPLALTKRNALSTTFLCWNVVTTDDPESLASTLNTSKDFGGHPSFVWTPELANVLLRTERAVLRRSQALIAAAITALLVSSGELSLARKEANGANGSGRANGTQGSNEAATNGGNDHVPTTELVVAYCGGLICQYKGYVEAVHANLEALREDVLADKETRVSLKEASEGGVIGAGVLAATVAPPASA